MEAASIDTPTPGKKPIPEKKRIEAVQRWLDGFFLSYYGHRPVNASFVGERGHDHRLPDYSDNAVGDLLAEGEMLTAEAQSWEGNAVGDAASLDVQLVRGFLDIQAWEYTSDHFHRGNPSHHTGEAVFGVMGLFLARSLPEAEQFEAACSRMDSIPGFLGLARELVRAAPEPWTQRAIRECDGAIAFFSEGWKKLPGLAGREEAFELGASKAASAFSDHRAHLAGQGGAKLRTDVASGEEAFALHLRKAHFIEQTPDDIVAYAREEMARTRDQLVRAASTHGDRGPHEALTELNDLHPSVEAYYGRYAELWEDTKACSHEHDLVTWPDFPIEYVARPDWARAAAPHLYFLFYRSPPAVNRPDVHHYLVTPIEASMTADQQDELLRRNNDSVIKLNHVLHHGSIGHHVQNWNAFRSDSRVGRMAAVDCASRIAMPCGLTMAEGWACYATDLMAEFGMLSDLERLAELKSRIRMCARAIVDVELHTGRMSLEEAVTFYMREAGMPESAATNEAVKNSMFPAAALIYLMGSDTIKTLRADLDKQLGSAFSLRDFHDTFLSFGSVPVSLVADHMRRAAEKG